MKNLLIAASLLFAFSGSFAQEKGSKNVKPIKAPSSVSKGISTEVKSYKTGTENAKPIKGQSSSTSTKVVRPSKTTPVKVQRVPSNTSTRAAAGTRPYSNEKATGKGDKGSSVNTRNETEKKYNLESKEIKSKDEFEKPNKSEISNSQYCKIS